MVCFVGLFAALVKCWAVGLLAAKTLHQRSHPLELVQVGQHVLDDGRRRAAVQEERALGVLDELGGAPL